MGPNAGGLQQQHQFPDQLKLEYMLRFHSQRFLKSIFPFVPLSFLQELMQMMQKRARMSFKDTAATNRLFAHLSTCAQANILTLDRERRKCLLDIDPKAQYVNLKELRDQMLGGRCSNGKLFMFGMANEGRLGVPRQQANNEVNRKEPSSNEFAVQLRGLQLVQFPLDVRSPV